MPTNLMHVRLNDTRMPRKSYSGFQVWQQAPHIFHLFSCFLTKIRLLIGGTKLHRLPFKNAWGQVTCDTGEFENFTRIYLYEISNCFSICIKKSEHYGFTLSCCIYLYEISNCFSICIKKSEHYGFTLSCGFKYAFLSFLLIFSEILGIHFLCQFIRNNWSSLV